MIQSCGCKYLILGADGVFGPKLGDPRKTGWVIPYIYHYIPYTIALKKLKSHEPSHLSVPSCAAVGLSKHRSLSPRRGPRADPGRDGLGPGGSVDAGRWRGQHLLRPDLRGLRGDLCGWSRDLAWKNCTDLKICVLGRLGGGLAMKIRVYRYIV